MEFHDSKQFAADDVKVALVDIDETVCHYPNKRRYDLAEPLVDNIAKINNAGISPKKCPISCTSIIAW